MHTKFNVLRPTDETSNWKTIAGTWFRFKYPSHWDLGDCGPPDIIYLDNEVVDCRGGLSDISVRRIDKKYSYLSDKSKGVVVEERTISLDGKDAIQVDFAAGNQLSGLSYTVTEVVNGDVVYDIVFFSDGKPDEVSNRNIYNQIISTFKFVYPD